MAKNQNSTVSEKRPLRIGIIGCGDIARKAYVPGMRKFPSLIEIVACADLNVQAATAFAADLKIAKAMSVEELLADANVDLVINLTIPQAHAAVNLAALAAGKHVFVEKPFALSREEAAAVLKLANQKGLRTGSAPDTFLGGGIQTCRKAIDDGWIGRPLSATAFMACGGHESWHKNPAFYYTKGGGPLLDMGPYYITALVSLLGPVKRVAGMSSRRSHERIATCPERLGEKLPVEVETHVSGTLEFESGVIANLVMSFDVIKHNLPLLEIYGTEGSLSVPDPNTFGGPARIYRSEGENPGWREMPLMNPWTGYGRGLGVADMVAGILENRPHRASGELASHVLDVMLSLLESAENNSFVLIKSRVERPNPIQVGKTSAEIA